MIPILTPQEMAAVDAAAPEPVEVLIERAGAAVAVEARRLLGGTYGKRVAILAGKGNNGSDGRAAARRLRARGVRCLVVDAASAPARLPSVDLVVDAAYGTGFRGTFDPPELPPLSPPVLAVDIASGVSGLTGEASGRPWRADATVTFAALKPGLLLADGPELSGRVAVADIGLDVGGATAHLVEDTDLVAWLPSRARAAHKWASAVWVVAGSPGMTGAAHLCAASAQRAGAGYVRLSTPGSATDPMAPTEAVVVGLPGEGWAAEVASGAGRFGAVAVGPGLGRSSATGDAVRELVATVAAPVVVDGDGLHALGRDAADVVRSRPADGGPVVLTPHDGELRVLTGASPDPDRLGEARRLAAATGCVVLLKGPTTVVAGPDGSVLVVTTGDARLATAGTGDVLTGVVAALLAQGMSGLRAAAAAAHLHGRAGALAWPRGTVASDVVDRLPAALAALPGVPTCPANRP